MAKQMEKNEKRSKIINVRVTGKEYDTIRKKAAEANLSISNYARRSTLGKEINLVLDGKHIALQLARLHSKMQNYHYDMNDRIQRLKDAVNANKTLLRTCDSGRSDLHDIAETLRLQGHRIDAVLGIMMDAYAQQVQKVEEDAHTIISPII